MGMSQEYPRTVDGVVASEDLPFQPFKSRGWTPKYANHDLVHLFKVFGWLMDVWSLWHRKFKTPKP